MAKLIKLSKRLGRDSAVDPFDVQQVKKALNRLGIYFPNEAMGITAIPDDALFDAIKDFQRRHDLPVTGTIKPDDITAETLVKHAAKTPEGYYRWRTMEDNRVRPAHAAFNRTIRKWSDAPDPGEEPRCRCWAEPVEQSEINFPKDQLRDKFKHAKDLGVDGNSNDKNLDTFKKALGEHIKSKDTLVIPGSFRGKKVTHYYNPKNGVNVMIDDNKKYLSNWKLSEDQAGHVMSSGRLGGSK